MSGGDPAFDAEVSAIVAEYQLQCVDPNQITLSARNRG
jgi:hypothetical protein